MSIRWAWCDDARQDVIRGSEVILLGPEASTHLDVSAWIPGGRHSISAIQPTKAIDWRKTAREALNSRRATTWSK